MGKPRKTRRISDGSLATTFTIFDIRYSMQTLDADEASVHMIP